MLVTRETDALLFDVTIHGKIRLIGEKLDVRRRLPLGKYDFVIRMRGFYTSKQLLANKSYM